MVLLKFLKQQDWKFGIPAFIFLCLFGDNLFLLPAYFRDEYQLFWQFFCATGFLITYSLKFARKHNNLLIDQLKLVFYFLYFTLVILFQEDFWYRYAFAYMLLFFLFYLYLHSLFIFYTYEMEKQGKTIRKSFLYLIVVIQSIITLGVFVWAITQKVEAEKQKVLALEAKDFAKLAEKRAEEEAKKYKLFYDSLSRRK